MNKKELEQAKQRIAERDTFIAYRMLPHADFDPAYAQPAEYKAYDHRPDIPLAFQMGADFIAVSYYRRGFCDVLITNALYRGLADAQCDSIEEAMGRFKLLCDAHFKFRYTNRYVSRETLDAMHAARIASALSLRIAPAICFARVRENDLDDFLRSRLWHFIVPPCPRDPAEIPNPRLRELAKHYTSHYVPVVRKDIKHCPFA